MSLLRYEQWRALIFRLLRNLSPDARTRYVSSAIEDILGYLPPEVLNRPIWEFFHPEELSQARTIYSRSVRHDKAAGLNYFRVKHKDGHWVACECVFTVVCDVLVASTSIYRRGKQSQMRAADAPVVRRLFASSSRDPRYHMLSCMSTKFKPSPSPSSSSPYASHEPRAALFLNRFTRSAAVIYATPSVANILGVSPASLISTSFYYCIEECCLPQAIQCLESAKANDSIAYLRFWFRDPTDQYYTYSHPPPERRRRYTNAETNPSEYNDYPSHSESGQGQGSEIQSLSTPYDSDTPASSQLTHQRPSTSCSDTPSSPHPVPIELEAIVSCSSDGLVVIIRRARPPIPGSVKHPGHPIYGRDVSFATQLQSDPDEKSIYAAIDSSADGIETYGEYDDGKSLAPGGPEPEALMIRFET
ncbi:hypothetical protein MGYG_05117 [Nannizzia gypsea CBS 118893]|uniref:PAS domain-containing protein n=1 Tax=Arthroderma gypseum (strain ATCC MYA-4604 / CBS 118893) TaxID=535722 RepID=E4UYF2_ARTGP|nr:hypothetical protein MGYG_05117 [Nannizzia gypsea CBS 118893]EFR02115.1 hypothetical protein MGYG_05117 [Nannizzia gypsea CBS 118893]